MPYLTSRQYGLLKILLEAEEPLSTHALGAKMKLTGRQVNYNLQGVRCWLDQHSVIMRITPGVGVSLEGSPEHRQVLARKLSSEKQVQLVLTIGERCQMLALILLVTDTPMILAQIQRLAQVTRTTAMKDLDAIEDWFRDWDIVIERRPNFGCWVNASENNRRRLILALLWGHTPFGDPVTQTNYRDGLSFPYAADAKLLPLVDETARIIQSWNARKILVTVAFAEAQLGGRFTDEALLQLGLTFTILAQRAKAGKFIEVSLDRLGWLQALPLWPVGVKVAKRLAESPYEKWPEGETASIVMHLLSAARNERWPGDLDTDADLEKIVQEMTVMLTEAYCSTITADDRVLHDGIVIHIIPEYYKQRCQVWLPPSLPEFDRIAEYTLEFQLAEELASIFHRRTGAYLSQDIITSLAMLLRASALREQAGQQRQVLVVCPSGMATAQLLVARLRVHFPGLSFLRVISLRDLTPQLANTARFIISTVPLTAKAAGDIPVLQVHPLLMPEDIAKITKMLG